MNKKIKKIIGLILSLTISLVTISPSVSLASDNSDYIEENYRNIIEDNSMETNSDIEEQLLYEDKDENFYMTISYNSEENKSYLRGYINDELIEEGIIDYQNTEVVTINEFDGDVSSAKEIEVEDIVETGIEEEDNTISARATKYSYLGRIRYSNVYQYFNANIAHRHLPSVYKDYTIRNYVGSVVTLVTAIIGAFNLPAAIVGTGLKALLISIMAGFGIGLVGNQITKAFSATLNSKKIPVNMRVTVVETGVVKYLTGAYYIIEHKASKYHGQTFIEGWVSQNWKTSGFAKAVSHTLFAAQYPYSFI